MSEPMLIALIGAVVAIGGSTGFWTWLQNRKKTENAVVRLLMGLAYDKITHLGMSYIERGWISKDEYEEFRKYLFEPYKDNGGNGVAEAIMTQVSQLPMRSPRKYSEMIQIQLEKTEFNDGHR